MKRKQMTIGAAALFGLAAAPAAFADVTFNGFGQVIYGQALDGSYDAPAYDDDGGLAPESLFALQVTAPVSDKLDAVAQIVSRGRDDYEPEFAWAYARYQIDSDWSIKAGRQRAPLYRYSDYLEVGSAYTQMRPSLAVYAGAGDNFDGLNVGRSFVLGSWELSTNFIYGMNKDENEETATTIESSRQIGAMFEATYDDWLSLRLSGVSSKLSLDVGAMQPLLAGLVASGNAQTAADIEAKDEDTYFVGLAFGISKGNLDLEGEYIYSEIPDSFIGVNAGWYLSAGYSVGKLTPVVSYGADKAEKEAGDVTPVSGPAAAMLQPAVDGVIASRNTENTYTSVGVRYDLTSNAALKADYTRIDPDADGADSVDLVSAGLVFSF